MILTLWMHWLDVHTKTIVEQLLNSSNLDGAMKLNKSAQRREAGMASMHNIGCSGLPAADLKGMNNKNECSNNVRTKLILPILVDVY